MPPYGPGWKAQTMRLWLLLATVADRAAKPGVASGVVFGGYTLVKQPDHNIIVIQAQI